MNRREFSVRLSAKGSFVVPKEIRERHGWNAATKLVLEDQGDSILIRESVEPAEEPAERKEKATQDFLAIVDHAVKKEFGEVPEWSAARSRKRRGRSGPPGSDGCSFNPWG